MFQRIGETPDDWNSRRGGGRKHSLAGLGRIKNEVIIRPVHRRPTNRQSLRCYTRDRDCLRDLRTTAKIRGQRICPNRMKIRALLEPAYA